MQELLPKTLSKDTESQCLFGEKPTSRVRPRPPHHTRSRRRDTAAPSDSARVANEGREAVGTTRDERELEIEMPNAEKSGRRQQRQDPLPLERNPFWTTRMCKKNQGSSYAEGALEAAHFRFYTSINLNKTPQKEKRSPRAGGSDTR